MYDILVDSSANACPSAPCGRGLRSLLNSRAPCEVLACCIHMVPNIDAACPASYLIEGETLALVDTGLLGWPGSTTAMED